MNIEDFRGNVFKIFKFSRQNYKCLQNTFFDKTPGFIFQRQVDVTSFFKTDFFKPPNLIATTFQSKKNLTGS